MDQKELAELLKGPFDRIEGTSYDSVYSRKALDFVVRLPKPDQESFSVWNNGHNIAMKRLGGKIARFSTVSLERIAAQTSTSLTDSKKDKLGSVIIQEKVSDYYTHLKQLVDNGNIAKAISLVHSLADLDREIMARGCFIPDLSLRKYGINKNGETVRYELGDIETGKDFKIADHIFREGREPGLQSGLNMRGFTHYMRLYEFSKMDSRVMMAYKARIGLNFDYRVFREMFETRINEKDMQKWQNAIFHVLDPYASRMPASYKEDKLQTVVSMMKSDKYLNLKRLVWGVVWRHKYTNQFIHLARQELLRSGFGTKEPVPSTEYVTPYISQ